ncbi:NAD-dependent epimerase/dehydratase family protein [Prosthecobacter sp.]
MHPVVAEDLAHIAAQNLDWERFRGKTVLITGAGGMLPAYMVETLLLLNRTRGLGCQIIGLIRNPAKARERFKEYLSDPMLVLVEADVAEGIPVEKPCEFVIHAASQASPKYFGTDPVGTMAANLNGTWHALRRAQEWRSERFLLFSSSEVYGQVSDENRPTAEGDYGYLDILNPRACYAESKRAAETLAISFAAQYQVPAVIVRPYHSYGPGMALDDGRIFADLVRDIIEGRDLVLLSDGSAVRAFCYLSDAVSGFFTVLFQGETGCAYNVGNPAGMLSIRELAELLTGIFPERGLKVVHKNRALDGYLPSTVSRHCPNIDLISHLGWKPARTPAEGFERTLRTFL